MSKSSLDDASDMREPANGETLIRAIERLRATLTAQEGRAAAYLLQHYPSSGLGAMARFARAANVSPQTVLRFLAKLDVTSWEAFQDRLRAELAHEVTSPLGRWTAYRAAPAPETDWLGAFGTRLARNVAETFAGLVPADFETVARAIADPRRRVFVIGGRFTQQLARLLVRHLQIVRGGVEEVGSLTSTWPDRLIDIGGKAVVVAYDIRRYSPDVVRFAALAREQGAAVVAITDSRASPIAAHAAHTLAGVPDSVGAWDSIIALMAITEALVARVTELAEDRTADRLAKLESLRERLFHEDEG